MHMETLCTGDEWLAGLRLDGHGEGALSLGECITQLLLAKGQTLGVAESCTGGHIAAALTAGAGASQCFLGSAVAYTGKAKCLWAGLSAKALEAYGEVSAPTTRLLAEGVRKTLEADWGLAVTGYAGPTGEKVGLCFVACAGPNGLLQEASLCQPGPRTQVQAMAAAHALEVLRRCLLAA